jgi:CRISPR/Cas system-associated exonuclease Cas4 (RecB family)
MRSLSKSKLIAYLQCPKRLWLELHHPELSEDSPQAQAAFSSGHEVGAVARKIYDPENQGTTLRIATVGVDRVVARTNELLTEKYPIFEAAFKSGETLAFADVLLPVLRPGTTHWRIIEVKSSTSVKDHYRDDVAIQSFIARGAGIVLASVSLACIDSSWVYQGDGKYHGLLVETDLTDEVMTRENEVEGWIAKAQAVSKLDLEPAIKTGKHCAAPHECSFLKYCQSKEPKPKYPASWLPAFAAKKMLAVRNDGAMPDMAEVADDLLNAKQLRVKTHTLSQTTYFDAEGAAADLAPHGFPAYFLDFETNNFAVPIWKGTRPYQQIPFQFSLHTLQESGTLEHSEFLSLDPSDPSQAFAEALASSCGDSGPIYAYNAAFEGSCIKQLIKRFPNLHDSLFAISNRLVDLLPIARERYYHPSQKGSWSIKAVLPAFAPDLNYQNLAGVKDGEMAMNAYAEAVVETTTNERRQEIRQQLLDYCKLDTYAMVRLWQHFSGRNDLKL